MAGFARLKYYKTDREGGFPFWKGMGVLLFFLMAEHSGAAPTLTEILVAEGFTHVPLILRSEDQRLSLPVTMNGRGLRLLLDTGAPATLISRQAAERNGIAVEKIQGETRGINGVADRQAGMAQVQRFAAGGLELVASPVVVSNFRFPYLFDNGFDGLLGLVTLKYNNAVLWLGPQRRLFLSPNRPSSYRFSRRAAELGYKDILLQVRGGHYLLPVQVNGVELNAILDTGSSDSVVSLDFVQREKIVPYPAAKPLGNGMDGRAASGKVIRPKTLSIAGMPLQPPFLAAMPLEVFKESGASVGFLLSFDLLEPLDAVLDIGNDRLYLRPPGARRQEPEPSAEQPAAVPTLP